MASKKLDVRPSFAPDDSTNLHRPDAILRRQYSLGYAARGMALPNRPHIGLSKFRHWAGLTGATPFRVPLGKFSDMSARIASSLGVHICNVVSGRTQEEVIGTAAGRIVAAMQNVYQWINGAMGYLPGIAMGERIAPLDAQHPVSLPVSSPHPLPTTVSFTHLGPKSVLRFPPAGLYGAAARTVNTWIEALAGKRLAAPGAITDDHFCLATTHRTPPAKCFLSMV